MWGKPNYARRRRETDVLQVITSTDRRGAEVFAVDLGEALTRRGRRVRTVALTPGDAPGGLDVPTLGQRRLGAGTLAALRIEARAARLVIAHGSTTLPACALATIGAGVPFVYRNIGDPAHWSGTRGRRLRSSLLLRRARAVVALSPGTAGELADRYRVQPSRIRVIPTGSAASRFQPADEGARLRGRETFGLTRTQKVVLYLGALSSEKKVGLAIEAVARLAGVHLLVVGDGPERRALELLAREVAPEQVRFAGAIEDPAQALAAADVLVLPSSTEGLPAVLIEAGLSRVPVVATDVGLVRDIVVDRRTGLLVPTGDVEALAAALAAALGDAARLAEAARVRCLERFELGVVAALWHDLICEIIGFRLDG
jgi:glycosyltransferase involved in cell wall biosynthesis